jgi:hypothetical protein
MGASRFSNEYVRDHYEVAKLCGAKGGGFVVDTHTLHRGAVEGSLARTVVVGEYHAAGKCAAMDALGLGLPCPSGDQFFGPLTRSRATSSCVSMFCYSASGGSGGADGGGSRGVLADAALHGSPVADVQSYLTVPVAGMAYS